MLEKITFSFTKLYIKFAVLFIFLKKERIYGDKSLSLRKLCLLAKGFYSAHPIKYNFKKYKYSDYISDLENVKLGYSNHPYNKLLRNKFVFSIFFNNYFRTPVCYCIINRAYIEPTNNTQKINSISSLFELLSQKRIILKPIFGARGQGIYLIENSGLNDFKINKKVINREALQNFFMALDNYLVCEFIEQSIFSKQFFPDSTNTIRITTLCYSLNSSAFVPYSLMRFGRPKSIPADNSAIGGIFSLINLDTGELMEAVEIIEKGKIKFHSVHPDTGVLIKGVTIPNWEKLLDYIKNCATIIKPIIKIVGWDIILTNDSFVVIEGNNAPDLFMQGLNYPLAKNLDVLEFLRHYKIR